MKRIFTTVIFLLTIIISQSQNLKSDTFELYLNDYQLSEVNISKGMYMTQNKQYFYEGQVEVTNINTNKTKMYSFYFSTWDTEFKEFIVKDAKFINISPDFTFTNNNTIKYTNNKSEEISYTLKNAKNEEMAILSCMLIWLENFKTEK